MLRATPESCDFSRCLGIFPGVAATRGNGSNAHISGTIAGPCRKYLDGWDAYTPWWIVSGCAVIQEQFGRGQLLWYCHVSASYCISTLPLGNVVENDLGCLSRA